MAHFFRDQQLSNLSVAEDGLRQINAVFENREKTINADVPANDNTGKRAFLNYIKGIAWH